VGRIIDAVEDQGFEVRHEENLREHYALTLMHWSKNLDDHWDEAVAEVGIGKARVWRLYLAASRMGFARNMIQLHQVLAVTGVCSTDPPAIASWTAAATSSTPQ
jgi:cyclopropane-fatty-acyl-phospholipid synthase